MRRYREPVEDILLIFAIAAVLLFPLALSTFLNTSIPLAAVESTSMVPTLNVGDVVIVTGVDPESIKVGDIIVFNKIVYLPGKNYEKQLQTPVVHRVVDIVEKGGLRYFKTKGDANPLPDHWYVPEDAVLGKVLCLNGEPFRIPYVGYFSIFFHDIIGD